MLKNLLLTTLALSIVACSGSAVNPKGDPSLSFPGEKRISNIRQLTFGGTNAEAYWSFDGRWLTFQHAGTWAKPMAPEFADKEVGCDQIYAMRADGTELKRISNGEGRTTCSYYYPSGKEILFSSTFSANKSCPVAPDKTHGYVWPIYNTYQIYKATADGKDPLPIEVGAPTAYNAEATVCKDGSVIFTSDRDGDLNLYRGQLDRDGQITEIKKLTTTLGYDGGAFFSADCKKVVWRASRPHEGKEADDYKALLRNHLIRPGQLEIWTANSDGSHPHQVTRIGSASFAPYFTPDSKQIVFASNPRDPRGRKFDIYMINTNGTGLEQITNSDTFDSFPMFSPNGKYLAFSSNRNAKKPRDTNVFVADWKDTTALPMTPVSMDDKDPANRFQAVVEKLSSPEFEGRGVTTAGIVKAEALVKDRFTVAGLKPYFKAGDKKGNGFEQPVTIQTGVQIIPEKTNLTGTTDFSPASFSSNGSFSGTVVDAGYGISAPELGINDYQKLDFKSKIVLIRRHVPAQLKMTTAQERTYGDLRYKTFLAREKGAKAVVFWEADESVPEDMSKILKGGDAATSEAGIPVLFVKRDTAKKWLVEKAKISGQVELTRTTVQTHNIIGMTGKSCGKVAPVVIGAHLDHLGFGSSGSLEPSKSGLHPGADDNGSGIAALTEIARTIGNPDHSCYIFAAFTGEEIGIVGSSQIVELLKSQHVHPKAMLNMDMVGRLENNSLLVFGTDSASEFKKLVSTECETKTLTCAGGGDGYGPSDHMPFYVAGIPVLHFFTGPHADYHKTTDRAEYINATGGIQVAELVTALALKVGSAQQPLHFQKASTTTPSLGHSGGYGDRKSYGAYLGTVPDYAAMTSASGPGGDSSKQGVKIAGVRPGSPTEKAGVQPGDILQGIDEDAVQHKIQNLEDFMFVLSSLKPGQKITMHVTRSGKAMVLPAVVGKRE